MTKTIKKN